MIMSILNLKTALQGLMSALPTKAYLSEADFIHMLRIARLLKPFMVAQKMLKGKMYVTCLWILHILHTLQEGLQEVKARAQALQLPDQALGAAATTLYKISLECFGPQTTLPLQVLMAVALNPRTKLLLHLNAQ